MEAKLLELLKGIKRAFDNEKQLQDVIEQLLYRNQIPYTREVKLKTGRVDFVLGDVLVEIKTKGSPTRIYRQVADYLTESTYKEAILITTKPLRLPLYTAEGKQIHVIDLWKNFL